MYAQGYGKWIQVQADKRVYEYPVEEVNVC